MDTIRSIARWLCAISLSLALSAWILSATLHTTLLNREMTKQWLTQSELYDRIGGLLQIKPSEQQGATLISGDILQQAFTKTFPPSYLQSSTETVLDASYDWIEGKRSAIQFSIPVQEKAQEFSNNLAALIEPKLAELPTCGSRMSVSRGNDISCLPAGVSAADYAKQLTQPASNESGFLSGPLTQESLRQGGMNAQLTWLPAVTQVNRTLVVALPIAALIAAALYVALSNHRWRGVSNIGRQMVVSAALTLVGGLFVWYAGSTIDVSSAVAAETPEQTQQVVAIANPLVRTILPSVGQAISLYSGLVAGIGALLWAIATIVRRTRPSGPPGGHPAIPTPTTQETHLPPPAPTQMS